MANLSTLLSVNAPSGFWIKIIRAFENVTANYVLAIIFLTVVLRLIWGFVELANKYASRKQSDVQAKMQPELDRLKVKYKNQPDMLMKKQKEVQQRYMGRGMAGIFLIMFITLGLNLLVFFTLFSGLNSMATYKTSSNYDNLKYEYANCLNIADEYLGDEPTNDKLEMFQNYENISFVVSEDGTTIKMILKDGENETEIFSTEFKTDFSGKKVLVNEETGEPVINEETGEPETVDVSSNENIFALIQKLKIHASEEDLAGQYNWTKTIQNKDGEDEDITIYLSTAIQEISMKTICSYYENHKDNFLWIENIWQADSPFVKSISDYKSTKRQLGKNAGENEEEIYNAFMKDLRAEKNKTNGYFILPILCVLSSALTLYVTTLYTKIKNKRKGIVNPNGGFKKSQIILPIILGVFALFYNSVFAIYLIVGQLVSALVTPLQLLVIDKIVDKKKKEEEDKIIMDYSRKF